MLTGERCPDGSRSVVACEKASYGVRHRRAQRRAREDVAREVGAGVDAGQSHGSGERYHRGAPPCDSSATPVAKAAADAEWPEGNEVVIGCRLAGGPGEPGRGEDGGGVPSACPRC